MLLPLTVQSASAADGDGGGGAIMMKIDMAMVIPLMAHGVIIMEMRIIIITLMEI